MMSEEIFDLVEKTPVHGGDVRLRYGASKGEPLAFILTLTQQFVARETGKVLPLSAAEMDAYISEMGLDLKQRALAFKRLGVNTGELN